MRFVEEEAFRRFQDLALKIAEECDTLLDEQREVANFADNLRTFLVDVREMVSLAVTTDTGCTVAVPLPLHRRITTELANMERAVGLEVAPEEPIHVLSAAPLLARRSI